MNRKLASALTITATAAAIFAVAAIASGNAHADEVNARNAEDSGSFSFATLPRSIGPSVIMAGPAR